MRYCCVVVAGGKGRVAVAVALPGSLQLVSSFLIGGEFARSILPVGFPTNGMP